MGKSGTSNTSSSVLRINVANIATITLSVITTHVKTISRVKTLKHQRPRGQSTPKRQIASAVMSPILLKFGQCIEKDDKKLCSKS